MNQQKRWGEQQAPAGAGRYLLLRTVLRVAVEYCGAPLPKKFARLLVDRAVHLCNEKRPRLSPKYSASKQHEAGLPFGLGYHL